MRDMDRRQFTCVVAGVAAGFTMGGTADAKEERPKCRYVYHARVRSLWHDFYPEGKLSIIDPMAPPESYMRAPLYRNKFRLTAKEAWAEARNRFPDKTKYEVLNVREVRIFETDMPEPTE